MNDRQDSVAHEDHHLWGEGTGESAGQSSLDHGEHFRDRNMGESCKGKKAGGPATHSHHHHHRTGHRGRGEKCHADNIEEQTSSKTQIHLWKPTSVTADSLRKGYLLPKDHAMHIPPHVALSQLEDEVDGLMLTVRELQNRNYEKDKGKEFEGSYTRVGFIMIITYFTLCGYMIAINVPNPFLNAIVPTVGFNLSTWSLPWVKQLWMGLYDYNWGKRRMFNPPASSLNTDRNEQSGLRNTVTGPQSFTTLNHDEAALQMENV